MAIPKVDLLWDSTCLLGEGPLWLDDEKVLKFVDIKGGDICTFDPEAGTGTKLRTGGNPSFILREEGGGLLVGSRNAIHRLTDSGLGPVAAAIPEPEGNRTNDATVDCHGRLWFGTMDDAEESPLGAVWRLDHTGLHAAGPRAVVTNGPALNGDGSLLYHVDSGDRSVWRHTVDAAGNLGEASLFLKIADEDGYPDGIVTDAEDCLWVALWDGWAVRRYAPDGTLLLHVPIPCARVTKIALGGPDLTTAFVTTARIGLDAAALAEQPHAGGLFAFNAPAPGRIVPSARIV